MTQLYNPNQITAQPAAIFNGLGFDGMSQWGQMPMNNGVDLAAPMTSGYTFDGINPTKLGSFNSVNLDGAQIYQSPLGGTNPVAGVGGGAGTPSSIWSNPLQTKLQDGSTTGGWLSAGLGIAQGVGNLYLGMKQYQLAKDTLANNKEQFERNYAAQRTLTNAQLEDRQRARVSANPGAYQSVGDYMAQNRVR